MLWRFWRKAVRRQGLFFRGIDCEKRIPFDVSADPFYSESNMAYLKKVIDDIESGKAALVEHELIED